MPRILLTAFEPYDRWRENSSWLTLIELTRWFEGHGQVVTRRYPVNLTEITRRMAEDLRSGYDFAIHLGQSPGCPTIKLESTGLNTSESGIALVPGAPAAYRSMLPLSRWGERLNSEGIPTTLSHHAGTQLCNATLFLSQHIVSELEIETKCCFIHLPLAPHQVSEGLQQYAPLASMSLPMMAYGISIILKQMIENGDD